MLNSSTVSRVEWIIRNGGSLMAPNPRDQKWYSLAEQASKETDPDKLTTLIAELCSALDDRAKPTEGNSPNLRNGR